MCPFWNILFLGYELQGNSTIRCLEDQTFDNPTPVCTLVECETPQPLQFGIYEEDASGFLFMSSIVYKCNEGYEMVSGDELLSL